MMAEGAKLRVVVPVDGSANSTRAVTYAVGLVQRGIGLDLHILNVQPKLGGAANFVPRATVKEYHQEEGAKALATARTALDGAGVSYQAHIALGSPGEVIAAFAKEHRCDQVIMGTRGLGAAVGLILGSIASEVVRRVDIPVTLVK